MLELKIIMLSFLQPRKTHTDLKISSVFIAENKHKARIVISGRRFYFIGDSHGHQNGTPKTTPGVSLQQLTTVLLPPARNVGHTHTYWLTVEYICQYTL